ncbi:lysophospholipase L2 [Vibrio maritimus]|uniref:Lysophospholipase L2 n=1 Tax=Vibrio maritimus TaxID=990268 RepID=A0A090SVL5_9VIBR|nr:lysophospholipase L2 [Vibrio maritimus]
MAAKQCIQQTRQVKIPLLLVQAGADQIVSNQDQQRFVSKLSRTNQHAKMVTVEGAKHEVLFERDAYRNQALDAVSHFFSKQ